MIVDDEPIVGRVAQRVIGRDHDTTLVSSGREALELVRSGARFDVIVCDLTMPEMNGFELHEEIGRLAPDQADVFVFMTGDTNGTTLAFFESAGLSHLEKPFAPAMLRAAINRRVR